MKKLNGLLPVVLLLAACGGPVKTEQHTVKIKAYGPEEVDYKKAVPLSEMMTEFNKTKEEQEFTFEGEITEVCKEAGCWVKVKTGGEPMMVFFQDHFGIPTNTKKGTKAYFHGWAYMDTIPAEHLQHYAQDAGKSKEEIAKITEPKIEMNFEADGILFREEKHIVK